MLSRSKPLKIGRVLATVFNLRVLRSTQDDTGINSHFSTTARKKKLSFQFEGPWSALASRAIQEAFPLDLIEAHEARLGKDVLMPCVYGKVTDSKTNDVFIWSINPTVNTLTVRQVLNEVHKPLF